MMETWTRRSLTRRIAVPLLIASTALVMAPALLMLSRRSTHGHDLLMEYESLQASAVILELFVQRRPIDPAEIDPSIIGFGIYNSLGELQLQHGSVPGELSPNDAEGYTLLRDAEPPRIRVVRILGRTMPMGRTPLGAADAERPSMRGPGSRMHGIPAQPLVLVDYDISDHLAEQRFGRLVLTGFALALAGLSCAAIMLHHRLERFAEQEERRRKLVELGHASRTLAHEIKNPLGAIRMQTALLRKRLHIEGSSEMQSGIEILEKETERIVVLVDEMRNFLRSGAGTPQQLDLVEFLHETCAQYKDRVTAHLPESPAPLNADPTRLRSIVENLLSNALEASPSEQPVRLSLQQHRRNYRLTVSDAGPGVAPEDRERIFGAFYSTKPHGSGVGLAVVRQFVESAGGKVTVGRSDEGGAEFIVSLPRAQPRN
ncbi:MAG: HAMP domain-containing histidine kinase [Spirochaeta sp.]|nr:HAMP domain-containing histidine kinase [Spirochaeta sp.]